MHIVRICIDRFHSLRLKLPYWKMITPLHQWIKQEECLWNVHIVLSWHDDSHLCMCVCMNPYIVYNHRLVKVQTASSSHSTCNPTILRLTTQKLRNEIHKDSRNEKLKMCIWNRNRIEMEKLDVEKARSLAAADRILRKEVDLWRAEVKILLKVDLIICSSLACQSFVEWARTLLKNR